MNFVSRYQERVGLTHSVQCVGLDLDFGHIPPTFSRDLKGLERYARKIIKLASKTVPVVKFQSAFYEAMGPAGIAVLNRLIKYAKSLGLLVILDAKRMDIGNTMSAYGVAIWDWANPDGCTIGSELGPTFMGETRESRDQIWLPKMAELGAIAICMVRTSNPQAPVLQDEPLASGQLVYEHLAVLARGWNDEARWRTNGEASVGMVLGATWPEQARRCRELAGDDVLALIPGYGAQGGGADGAVVSLLNSRGEVMGTINNSRGITKAWIESKGGLAKEGDPLWWVAAAIDKANADLNAATAKLGLSI